VSFFSFFSAIFHTVPLELQYRYGHNINTPLQPLWSADISLELFMAVLHSRCGLYTFVLWFPLSSIYLFSSPNLSRRILDVYHTSTHDVALVRI